MKTCIICGKQFEASGKASRAKRCLDCRKKAVTIDVNPPLKTKWNYAEQGPKPLPESKSDPGAVARRQREEFARQQEADRKNREEKQK
ncbi:MAG: hypothetical protein FWF33_00590 [Clostridiales bacterium]|nr:hypothetical protein [Clostridiales bacterium]